MSFRISTTLADKIIIQTLVLWRAAARRRNAGRTSRVSLLFGPRCVERGANVRVLVEKVGEEFGGDDAPFVAVDRINGERVVVVVDDDSFVMLRSIYFEGDDVRR